MSDCNICGSDDTIPYDTGYLCRDCGNEFGSNSITFDDFEDFDEGYIDYPHFDKLEYQEFEDNDYENECGLSKNSVEGEFNGIEDVNKNQNDSDNYSLETVFYAVIELCEVLTCKEKDGTLFEYCKCTNKLR